MFKGINAIEFNKRFSSNEDCYNYLVEIKWRKPYQCSRCGCTKSYKGRTYYYRRCKQCGYDESVMANTVFHGIKMPILKHFTWPLGSPQKRQECQLLNWVQK